MCSSDLTKRDEEIIRALQEDFPLCEEPYKVLAERAGVSEKICRCTKISGRKIKRQEVQKSCAVQA